MSSKSRVSLLIAAVGFTGLLVAGSCSDKTNPANAVDSTPPAAVSSLTVDSNDGLRITLSFDAPGDDSLAGRAAAYDLRYSSSYITVDNFDSATAVPNPPIPADANTHVSVVVLCPHLDSTFYFALRSVDDVGNWSALSNVVSVVTVPSADIAPPAGVIDLHLRYGGDDSVTLLWTAVGDDSLTGTAAAYDLRMSFEMIMPSNFDSAISLPDLPIPAAAGTPESLVIRDLPIDSTCYFALKVGDDNGNWSPLSNDICVMLSNSTDSIPPARVLDLVVADSSASTLTLTWTAVGDDSMTGTAAAYDIRYATAPFSLDGFVQARKAAFVPTPDSAGSQQSIVIDSLTPRTAYYFAMRTMDEAGNWSEMSNLPIGRTADGPQIVWKKTYGDGGDYFTTGVWVSPDGHIVAVGYTTAGSSAPPNAFVMRTDLDGNLDWLRILDGAADERAEAVIDYGNVVTVTGSYIPGGSDTRYLRLTRLSNTGGVLLDTVLMAVSTRSQLGFSQIAPAPSSGIYLAAGGWYRISAQGSIVWSHSSDEFTAGGIIATSFGYIVAGSHRSVDPYDGFISEYAEAAGGDADGNPLWNRVYGAYLGGSLVTARSMGGFYYYTAQASADFVVAVSSNYSVDWEAEVDAVPYPRLQDFASASSGGCLAVGYTHRFAPPGDNPWIGRYYSDGTVGYSVEFAAGPKDGRMASVAPAGDGSMVAAGWTKSFSSDGSAQVYLIRLND